MMSLDFFSQQAVMQHPSLSPLGFYLRFCQRRLPPLPHNNEATVTMVPIETIKEPGIPTYLVVVRRPSIWVSVQAE
jgi:hypothetical protein